MYFSILTFSSVPVSNNTTNQTSKAQLNTVHLQVTVHFNIKLLALEYKPHPTTVHNLHYSDELY